MSKLLSKSLFFILFIFLLTSCSETPKWPEQEPKIESGKETIHPAEKRLQQANQRLTQAISKAQPEKNQLLLDIIDFLAAKISDLNLPGTNEYTLIATVLNNIEQNFLTEKQSNRYLLGHIKLLLSKSQYEKAEVLLDELLNESFSGLSPLQQLEYYRLRVNIFISTQQPLSAVKELLKSYQLVNSSPPILEFKGIDNSTQYLDAIWKIMSSFQIQELEYQLVTQFEQNEVTGNSLFQLMGWQELMILVKKHTRKYKLIKQLNSWSESFPQHMAKRSFILDQLKQRFKLLNNPQQIALLLPTQGKFAKPSQVIINGFLAAHYQQTINNKLIVRLYNTSEYKSIWPSYNKAVYEGADIIVGPFAKKDILELAQSNELPVITLALNNIKAKTDHKTKQLFQFALTPEDEVKIITNRAKQNGFINAALIVPDTKWGKRLELAFTQSWQEQGGLIVASQKYPAKTYDYSIPLKQLLQLDKSDLRKARLNQTVGFNFEFTPRRRQDIDVIFLAAFPKQAKQIPLQISYNHGAEIPVYATSHIIRKAFDKKENTDLNGITYTDMPWLLNPDLAAISRLNRQNQAAYQRLFSFGVDSYQIIPYLKLMASNSAEQFSGDTGILHINDLGYIKRQAPTALIVNGKPVINEN